MSFLKKLKFEKSKAQFFDSRKLLEANLKGNFETDNIKDNLNALAKQFDSPDYQLGVAMHYKNVGKWTPAIFRKSNQNMVLWSADDSPDTVDAYRNDIIDHIRVYIIEDTKNIHPENSKRKPGLNNIQKDSMDRITKAIFNK